MKAITMVYYLGRKETTCRMGIKSKQWVVVMTRLYWKPISVRHGRAEEPTGEPKSSWCLGVPRMLLFYRSQVKLSPWVGKLMWRMRKPAALDKHCDCWCIGNWYLYLRRIPSLFNCSNHSTVFPEASKALLMLANVFFVFVCTFDKAWKKPANYCL